MPRNHRGRARALPRLDPRAARDAELGLRAVAAGDTPLVPAGAALVEIAPREVVLSAQPAENGDGIVVRMLNPTDDPLVARVRIGFPVADVQPVRLDETPLGPPRAVTGGCVEVDVPAHALRSLLLR
jgi:mannosylglycerate hydrolase